LRKKEEKGRAPSREKAQLWRDAARTWKDLLEREIDNWVRYRLTILNPIKY
jgi:hypothetical protein